MEQGQSFKSSQDAALVYRKLLQNGEKHADILAGVKARVGIDPDKIGTPYVPQLSTWLNQERWKDGAGTASMSAADMEAAQKRIDDKARENRERDDRLREQRSNQLLRGAA